MVTTSCLSKSTAIHTWLKVATTVITKIVLFWDVTQCSLVEVHRSFRVIFCLPYQDLLGSYA